MLPMAIPVAEIWRFGFSLCGTAEWYVVQQKCLNKCPRRNATAQLSTQLPKSTMSPQTRHLPKFQNFSYTSVIAMVRMLTTAIPDNVRSAISAIVKTCPHCRRKVRLSPLSRRFLRQCGLDRALGFLLTKFSRLILTQPIMQAHYTHMDIHNQHGACGYIIITSNRTEHRHWEQI